MNRQSECQCADWTKLYYYSYSNESNNYNQGYTKWQPFDKNFMSWWKPERQCADLIRAYNALGDFVGLVNVKGKLYGAPVSYSEDWQSVDPIKPLTKKEIDKFVDENFDELLMKTEPCGEMQAVSELTLEQLDDISMKAEPKSKLYEAKQLYNAMYLANNDNSLVQCSAYYIGLLEREIEDFNYENKCIVIENEELIADYEKQIEDLKAERDEYKELNENTVELNSRLYKEIDRLKAENERLKQQPIDKFLVKDLQGITDDECPDNCKKMAKEILEQLNI